MTAARDLLLAAIQEQRPIVLFLGQDAGSEIGNQDAVLRLTFDKLGRSSAEGGWAAVLGPGQLPEFFYDWLAERFKRRPQPSWLGILREVPWSAIFTSAIDPTLKLLFSEKGREPQVVLRASEWPRVVRSKSRPPLYYLFGRAGESDSNTQPPLGRSGLNLHRISHALPLLGRILDTATSLGLVVIDGFSPGRDWLKLDDLLGAVGGAAPKQVIWFGGRPQLVSEAAEDFDAAVASGRILVERERLGTVIAEIRALGLLSDFTPPESEEAGVVSFRSGGRLETSPEERLHVEAVASIVDDSWSAFLPPLGPDAEYAAFLGFHGDRGGTRLLAEGVRRGFAVERDYEAALFRTVESALAQHATVDAPIVVHGQSATGKSIALARVVTKVREKKDAAVLYSIGRVPQSQEISSFCEAAEHAGAEATLIVCDANRDFEAYYDLRASLRSKGRRAVVLGSCYRLPQEGARRRWAIEAPTKLSLAEQNKLADLLANYFGKRPDPKIFPGNHILGFLYRYLPPSRARISAGLSAEVTSTERVIRAQGRRARPKLPNTVLAQRLSEAGFEFSTFFDEKQIAALDAGDAAGRIIDLVMVPGKLNCPVPVNLLLRATTEAVAGVDLGSIGDFFGDLDLFRWKWADVEQSELLVFPRLTLEADLICRRRLGSPEKEAERLIELVTAFRAMGVDSEHERGFLFSLLQQMGAYGPYGTRYRSAYVEVARALTDLRHKHGVFNPGLMLQESAFRRIAVREDVVEQRDRLRILEEARDAVQAALDGVENGTIAAARRTRQNLLVERASIYGFLANDRVKRRAAPDEIWSSYQAARAAIRQAVSVTDTYYPLDVGLWTPSDILEAGGLAEAQRAELTADIYATLDQVDPRALPPTQREKYDSRRMVVGRRLQDLRLTDDAYIALEASGSTAGYFLQARDIGPQLRRDAPEISAHNDLTAAKVAAEFLEKHISKIEHDERCLSLLLEYRWIAYLGRRPLLGERQPLPSDREAKRQLFDIVHALNRASGDAARHGTRYLEGVLAWTMGEVQPAIQIFRQLSHETEGEDQSRIVRRHLITGPDQQPLRFSGRVERRRSEGHWVLRVDDLNRQIDLLARDFPRDDVGLGYSIKGFSIAFNFIGPIADPLRLR